jgi:hypothetical protein
MEYGALWKAFYERFKKAEMNKKERKKNTSYDVPIANAGLYGVSCPHWTGMQRCS